MFERFVIFDDGHKESFESLLSDESALPHNVQGIFIQTILGEDDLAKKESLKEGLTETHVECAVNFLNMNM